MTLKIESWIPYFPGIPYYANPAYSFWEKPFFNFSFFVILPIIMHVIPNFRPFRSISFYGYRDKHLFLIFRFFSRLVLKMYYE